jgi:hypothetical protein
MLAEIAQAHYEAARAWMAMKSVAKANDLLDRALAINPQFAEAKRRKELGWW